MFKKCSKCKETKDINLFYKNKYKNDGYYSECKKCRKEYLKTLDLKESRKIYYQKNREKIQAGISDYYIKNKEKRLAYLKEYREKNKETMCLNRKIHYDNNKETILEKNKLYRIINKEKLREQHEKYKKENIYNTIEYKISKSISANIRDSIKNNKNGRHWEIIVGYSLNELINHLEKQFKQGMTWENYGRFGWHIDHIKPKSSFSYKSYEDEDFKECWALSNLQPLWWEDNLKKGTKIIS